MSEGGESIWEPMPKAAALNRNAPENRTYRVERFMDRSLGAACRSTRRVRTRAGLVKMIGRRPLPICRRRRIRAWDVSHTSHVRFALWDVRFALTDVRIASCGVPENKRAD